MYEKKKDIFFEKELWIKSNAEEYIKQVEEQERQERFGYRCTHPHTVGI